MIWLAKIGCFSAQKPRPRVLNILVLMILSIMINVIPNSIALVMSDTELAVSDAPAQAAAFFDADTNDDDSDQFSWSGPDEFIVSRYDLNVKVMTMFLAAPAIQSFPSPHVYEFFKPPSIA
jgi:hypothetical protein